MGFPSNCLHKFSIWGMPMLMTYTKSFSVSTSFGGSAVTCPVAFIEREFKLNIEELRNLILHLSRNSKAAVMVHIVVDRVGNLIDFSSNWQNRWWMRDSQLVSK
jgi:hypothetical protein